MEPEDVDRVSSPSADAFEGALDSVKREAREAKAVVIGNSGRGRAPLITYETSNRDISSKTAASRGSGDTKVLCPFESKPNPNRQVCSQSVSR